MRTIKVDYVGGGMWGCWENESMMLYASTNLTDAVRVAEELAGDDGLAEISETAHHLIFDYPVDVAI